MFSDLKSFEIKFIAFEAFWFFTKFEIVTFSTCAFRYKTHKICIYSHYWNTKWAEKYYFCSLFV